MKNVVLIILGAVFLFLLWNRQQPGASYEQVVTQPVSGDVTQVILEAIQKDNPNIQPLETIYINPTVDKSGSVLYNARFMFLETRGFFGIQYDVQARVNADGSVRILSKTGSAGIDREGPFKYYIPDKYASYKDIQDNLDKQLADMIASSKTLPGEFSGAQIDALAQAQRDKARSAALGGQ
jgi:hypothetical protein